MTIEEFFNMNVGDKFKVSNAEYVVVDTFLNGSNKCINYKMLNDNFNKICTLTQLFVSITGIHFITLAEKISQKTPMENVQEKINQLKLDLSKLEDEKKSLEIQVGKFYEIEFRRHQDNEMSKLFIYTVDKTTSKIYFVYFQSYKSFLELDRIISFKKIEDISVIEEAWKNV